MAGVIAKSNLPVVAHHVARGVGFKPTPNVSANVSPVKLHLRLRPTVRRNHELREYSASELISGGNFAVGAEEETVKPEAVPIST
eukprot:COSAG02_NODE_2701_length_8203_cov_7.719521_1_plen_85_part_00